MRKINRDNLPPVDIYEIGINKGVSRWRVAEANVIKAYKSNPLIFNNGEYVFPTHPSYTKWKNELINNQGEKCCFCEKAIKNGVIEHFRPKKGWQQNPGDPISRPGYYWLAYRWRNLLLSCTDCNESGQKGNLFPINGIRAFSPTCSINAENCNLINPYEEDPSTFISYYKSDPISLHSRGRETIEVLKLGTRADIKQNRKDIFDIYDLSFQISKLPHAMGSITKKMIDEANDRVRIKVKKKEPFSGMILENLKNGTLV
ncbi:hypothetical protein ASE40_13750 [Flavobacterium sp. Root935]|uniref:hypothetical protein n=1 Tax=Flavobacterium sp. Root935 TaxID=1736610 RepID=UPI00070C827C|nr:hypothetical protein [Flavobacterium sp. Root935]KRD59241.1 hypothetical protein ASE40_13750 [Flavobacterium sp. Root935]